MTIYNAQAKSAKVLISCQKGKIMDYREIAKALVEIFEIRKGREFRRGKYAR